MQGQNLIPYPYDGTEGNTNGITWTVNDDGSVTANGTASKEAPYSLIYPYNLSTMKSLQLGNTYIISDGLTDEQHTNVGYMQLVRYDKNNPTNFKYGVSSMKGTEIYTANDENILQYGIRLIIRNGATANNITFKPMLEVGTMSHEYQPTTLSNPTLKKEIGSALQPESIVNNQVTTETGFALDARQANPNIDGSLAKKISDLNGSIDTKVNALNPSYARRSYVHGGIGKEGDGWYRFARITFRTESYAEGAGSELIEVMINQSYTNSPGCFHKVDFYLKYLDSAIISTIGNNSTVLKKFEW